MSSHKQLFRYLLLTFCVRSIVSQLSPIDYIEAKDCTGQQFFDISHLRCADCPTQTVPTADRSGCQCAPGFKKKVDFGGFSLQCEDCNAQTASGERRKAATPDGWSCVTCVDQSNQPVDFDSTTGLCPSDCTNAGQFNYERTVFGMLQPNRTCGICAAGHYPSPYSNHESCVPCNPSLEGEDCHCSGNGPIGGMCFETAVLNKADLPNDSGAIYTFRFPDTNIEVQSAYAKEHLRAANALCAKRNLTACQLVGNLCVLTNYIFNSNERLSPCALYNNRSTQGTRQEWVQDMPWLYYLETEASVELSRESAIPVSYVFTEGEPNSKIRLVAAKYDLDGRFHGLEAIVGGTLQLCKRDRLTLDGAFLFGRKYKQTCQIPVKDFWDGFDTLYFYDLYLDYTAADGKRQLYALPVLDQNYRDGDEYVNRLSKADNINRWKLVRRLYLVDNVFGRVNESLPAMVVRYPAYIGLNIQLQTSKNGHILPPYIVINHQEIAQEKYDDEGAQVSLTFEVSYSIDSRRHDKDIEITMGILCTAAALWAFVRTYSWQRRAGKVTFDASIAIKWVLYGCGALADVFLLVMWSMSVWLTVGYKGQRVAFYMLPTGDQEWSFVAYLIAALSLKAIALLHTNIELMLTETFFIDWERPRGHIIPNDGEPGQAPPTADQSLLKPQSPVVIWRTYLVANEWNELQSYRKTSVGIQVVLIVFFLKWVNFEALAIVEPGASLDTPPVEYQDTRITRFAIAATLYLLIGFVQWTLNVLVIERIFIDHFRNFMDLCSVANISVLALTQPQFGYYIHGRSVHGHADTDMTEMNQMLQRERDNLCGQRGLEPGTEEQSFIVSLPNAFRERYNSILEPYRSPNLPASRLSGTDLTTSKMENIIKVYKDMNRYLAAFIDHGFTNIAYFVKNRNILEAVLDLELGDTTQTGMFYRDFSEIAYSRAFLYGNEWIHLSFDLLVFCMTDLIWHNFILAATVTFCISTLIRKIARLFYTNNLVKTSLVDERFLI